jgi:hypothetical protein
MKKFLLLSLILLSGKIHSINAEHRVISAAKNIAHKTAAAGKYVTKACFNKASDITKNGLNISARIAIMHILGSFAEQCTVENLEQLNHRHYVFGNHAGIIPALMAFMAINAGLLTAGHVFSNVVTGHNDYSDLIIDTAAYTAGFSRVCYPNPFSSFFKHGNESSVKSDSSNENVVDQITEIKE